MGFAVTRSLCETARDRKWPSRAQIRPQTRRFAHAWANQGDVGEVWPGSYTAKGRAEATGEEDSFKHDPDLEYSESARNDDLHTVQAREAARQSKARCGQYDEEWESARRV